MSPAISQTTYLVKLKERRQVAERSMAFQFEKPECFTFTAGQSVDLTLMNPSETDARFPLRVHLRRSASNRDPDARYGVQAGSRNSAEWGAMRTLLHGMRADDSGIRTEELSDY